MEEYYKSRPRAEPATGTVTPADSIGASSAAETVMSDFDLFRLKRITKDNEEGWTSELRRYLKDIPEDVTKDMDIVKWWQVCYSIFTYLHPISIRLQDHTQLYPTLARIALDILPCQASSVPCERLFSGSKQSAVDRRASLGAERFEELQIMKFAWREKIIDVAAWNSRKVEEVELDEYQQMLAADIWSDEYDRDNEDEFVMLD
jgi:hypothetical protein